MTIDGSSNSPSVANKKARARDYIVAEMWQRAIRAFVLPSRIWHIWEADLFDNDENKHDNNYNYNHNNHNNTQNM